MKILVVSLLRLGDILLTTSILRSLRKQHPQAEIHILINAQFNAVSEMIPYVSKVYGFDRVSIQNILGARDRNILEAYYRVEDLVDQLRSESYDQVINLTHNRLSGWLTTLIGCPQTRGVVFSEQGQFSLGSGWFEYLNDHAEPAKGHVFHFVDVFHYGTGLKVRDRRVELNETEKGKRFAEKYINSLVKKRLVLLQPFSSEEKKTLEPAKWKAVCEILSLTDKNIQMAILGAPSEKEILEKICTGTSFSPVVCDLDEAYSLLKRAELLITCDTSIKHLAAATRAKVLELSMGSSEYFKTGVYIDGAVIIQGLAPCAPCGHRLGCHQPSHLCADKIQPEMVAMVASSILQKDELALRMLAYEDRNDVMILKTQINGSGDWAAYPLGQEFGAEEINNWVDRSSFKLYLEGSHRDPVGEFGSEGVELKQLLEHIFPERSSREWLAELKILEKDIQWMDSQLQGFLERLKSILTRFHDANQLESYLDELETFCLQTQRSPLASYSRQISWSTDETAVINNTFQTVKKLREKLTRAHHRSLIELKLLRGLQCDFREVK